jgi:hypothetical protein
VSDLERLDPDLADLFAKERSEHVSEPMVRDEMLERIERLIRMAALAPAASTAATAAKGAAAVSVGTKIAVGIAIVTAFGGGIVVGRETAAPRTVASPAASPASVVANAPVIAPSTSTEPSATPVSDLPSAATAPVRSATPPSSAAPASDLPKEQALIDTARAALARGRGSDALAATDAHAARFPRGALAEEREALAVQALVLDGKPDAARARAAQFHRRYPSSIFRPAVERAISGL